MEIDKHQRQSAKLELLTALSAYGGDPKHEIVAAAIKKLCQLNPTENPAHCGALLDGEWLLISAPKFPQGELLPDGKFSYNLGRLAFNMFQPAELKIVIDQVQQPVFALQNGDQRSHDIVVDFTIIDQSFPKLKGVICNQGVCHAISDKVLQVKFTGATLAPRDLKKMEDWQAVFGEQRQPSSKTFKEQLMSPILRLFFGLVPPQGMNPETGEISFTMKRSPKGSLEILYLDEEIRITRGQRETILICQRLKTD